MQIFQTSSNNLQELNNKTIHKKITITRSQTFEAITIRTYKISTSNIKFCM